MAMFESITELAGKLAATGYFIDPVMTQVVFLAAKLQKPLLLEGPAGSGKTLMALASIHVLSEGRPTTTLVMCPSHITHKWAREVLLTIPRARTFLVEDMRNGGDPNKPHGVCEVKLNKGKTVYEGKRLSLAEMRRLGRKEWRKRFSGPTFFITGKDKGKLSYFWDHVYLKAGSGPNLGGVVNPDSGVAILDSEMEKLTALDFRDKVKVSETLTALRGGTTRFSDALLLRNGLFAAHAAPGQPKIVADRSAVCGAGKVRHLFGLYAGDVPPADGQENARGPDDGGQVLGRRPTGARHRRRPDERDGA
jgi:hypothetical protein